MGIRNFKHKGLSEVFLYGESRKFGDRYVKNASFILDYLESMKVIDDCKGVKDFHALSGTRVIRKEKAHLLHACDG